MPTDIAALVADAAQDAPPEAVTVLTALQADYAVADKDYQEKRAQFVAANEAMNAATLRRQQAGRALACYGVTVDS